jgi:branched-chain amino acid aminotransferase
MTTGSTIELHPKKQPLSADERAKVMGNLGFGRVFTEHMVSMRYRDGAWDQGVLGPYAPVTLDPAASVLHYGQAIFEGFKAYRQPELPVARFVDAADALIRQERDWVPSGMGESLYVRPLMIATEAALGVRPAREYLFLLFGSPSGSYFAQGVKPLTLWLCTDYVRAAPGGTGEAKCAGNYAASLVAQQKAIDAGCQQVIWLDAVQHEQVEEMGGMNLFFVYQNGGRVKLVTPSLTGTLLAGITRDSILTLAADLGYETEERVVTKTDWGRDLASGAMTEVFACGTAAVITPVGSVKFDGGQWTIHGGEPGPVSGRIRESLLSIQHGLSPDSHGWMHRVC